MSRHWGARAGSLGCCGGGPWGERTLGCWGRCLWGEQTLGCWGEDSGVSRHWGAGAGTLGRPKTLLHLPGWSLTVRLCPVSRSPPAVETSHFLMFAAGHF